jgi:hypothetical protein
MKLTSLLFLLLTLSSSLNAQTLSAEFYPDNEASGISEYPLQDGVLLMSGSTYQFGRENRVSFANPIGFSLSDDRHMVGLLKAANGIEAVVYNDEGGILVQNTLSNFSTTDETIGLTLLNNGEFVVRDNVANFSFFGPSGERLSTYSNSAGTSGGEQTSQIAVSSDGITKVVYNPVIQYQDGQGSRISLITGDNEGNEFFTSYDSVILSLSLTESDQTIKTVTENSAGERSIHWFDKFGNVLFEMTSDLAVDGFSVSSDGVHVAVFADNRVQVYNMNTRERLGSASSRSSIIQASYFPSSNLILAVGGEILNGKIENLDITAVDLQQRQIERVRLSEPVMYLDASDVTVENQGGNTYRIDGINRPIRVTANF